MRLLLTSDLHLDGTKFLWLLDEAPAHDAVLVAGDLLNIFSTGLFSQQTSGALRFRQALLDSGKSFAWCSGNHDFFDGNLTPISEVSPDWMMKSSPTCVGDGETRILEAGGEKVAITTLPWPVEGGDVRVNGRTLSFLDFVRSLLQEGQRLQAEMPWIVLCHEPPGETPLAAAYHAGEADFARRMIEESQPDFSLHGHVHLAPTAPGGSWICELGKTVCFNAGQSLPDEPPNFITLEWQERENWSAVWSGAGKTLQSESPARKKAEILAMAKKTAWWDRPTTIREPYPHIPEKEILAAMPKDLHPLWDQFMQGQGILLLDDGDAGIFPWDFSRFLSSLDTRSPLKESKR